MSASPLPSATGASRWLRILMIVLVSVAVGPLVAGTVYWVILTLSEIYRGTASPLTESPAVWAGVILIGYLVGVPYALVTSGAFALVAVLAGLRQLATALIIAIIPALLFFTASASVQPSWREAGGLSAIGAAMIVISTTVCWYLSRRWHSRTA